MALDRDALIQTFLTQAEETLRVMEESLVTLEAHPDDEELLHGIFRGAHRLKGDAALLGLNTISDFCHVFEDLLDRLRQRKFVATSAIVTVLLRFLDAVREMVDDVHQTRKSAAVKADPTDRVQAPRTIKSIRVDTDKLDRILNTTGEIAINREKLRQLLDTQDASALERILEAHHEADRLYLDLQEIVMAARMVALGPLFRPYLRTVRDLSEKLGKKATLSIHGEEVEVDTAIVEQLRDPLTHLIRNALDHGIETADDRDTAGKSPEGHLRLSAWQEAGSVLIQLSDDGRGLDREKIAAKVRAQNLAAEPEGLPDAELFNFLFLPGFSTASRVTEMSGRGVGLDIVRKNVESLRGTLSLESEKGKSTTFTLRLPLTLAIIQGFFMSAGEQTLILPLDSVAECLELPIENRRDRASLYGVVNLRGEPLPFVRLGPFFGLAPTEGARESVVVVRSGERRVGFVVDQLHGENQTVIKPLPRQFRGLEGIAASSILGNGRIGLILDVASLLKKTIRESTAAAEKV